MLEGDTLKIISKYDDITNLKNLGYKDEYINLLKEKLYTIYKGLINDEDLEKIDEFTLDEVGGMVIIENISDLQEIKEMLDEKLIDTYPEYVNDINLKDEIIYEIFILCNNEYGIQFFIPEKVVINDEELENWIEDNKWAPKSNG